MNTTSSVTSPSPTFPVTTTTNQEPECTSKGLFMCGLVALAAFAIAYKNRNSAGKLQFTKCEKDNPRHFRDYSKISTLTDLKINKTDIGKLHLSGSGQFGAEHIQTIADLTLMGNRNRELWFVDVRAERHCFVDGKPAVWKRDTEKRNESTAEVVTAENQLISKIANKNFTIKQWKGEETQMTAKVENEKTVVEAAGHNYVRFPIVEHHIPTDACVDSIVQFIKSHGQAHLHVHCYVKERSTLVLAMVDMLYNVHEIALSDITDRAQAIGGTDLFKVSSKRKKHSPELTEEKKKFLWNFYFYCRDEDPLVKKTAKTWTEWSRLNRK